MQKKTILEYCASNILIIPDALRHLKDISLVHEYKNSALFYKDLEHDLVDVEFYTNTPCIIYILKGRESLTTADNVTHTLSAGDIAFLPRGINLHSDFVRSTQSLQAAMVFFSDRVIADFLSKQTAPLTEQIKLVALQRINGCTLIDQLFSTLNLLISDNNMDDGLFEVKLLELLYLFQRHDTDNRFVSLLRAYSTTTPIRNIHRPMDIEGIHQLSVSDLAHLSGRSISSFNRDFKKAFHAPPKQWLTAKRMQLATELLIKNNTTVTEVAAELGYENISHFIKLFKSEYDITPKQFIHKH